MSAADIPQSLKKRRSSGNYSIENQGLVDLSGVIRSSDSFTNISSILKRKSDISRSVDMTRHTIEPATETTSMSIVKRQKVPSNQAVAVVSAQKMVGTSIFHPSREESVSDIATFQQNQGVSTVSRNKNMSKKQQNPFGDDICIQDAQYKEMTKEIVNEMGYSGKSKPEFSNAPVRDARDLGLAQRSKSPEPADFASISESKQTIKKSLIKRQTKPVPTAADAFDYLVDTFRGKSVNKDQTPKVKKHSLKSNIVRGIQDVNEICEEIGKNPNILRIQAQQESDIRALRSANRHFKGSIAAGGNKRSLTAGSLVTQRGGINNTTNVAQTYGSSNQYDIYGKFEKINGRVELHYFTVNGNRRITHEQASRVLSKKQLKMLRSEAMEVILGKRQPVQANNASTTPVQTVNKPTPNPGTHRTLTKQKVATRSRLVHRNKSGVM